MGLSKTTSNILKGGASAVGIAAIFTPVGAMCGLGGAAALGVDLVAGGAISSFVGKGVSGFKSFIDSHTSGSKSKTSSTESENTNTKETKKLSKKEKKALKKQEKKDKKAEAKEAESMGINNRTSSLSKKISDLEKEEFSENTTSTTSPVEKQSSVSQLTNEQSQPINSQSQLGGTSSNTLNGSEDNYQVKNGYQNSNGRNTGPMLNQFASNLSEAPSVSTKNRERVAMRFDMPAGKSAMTSSDLSR